MPTIADLRKQYSYLNGLDDADASEVVQRVFYPDRSVEEVATQLGVKLPKPEAPPAPSRNLAAVANDTVIEVANQALSGVKGIGEFFSPGNRISTAIDGLIEKGNESQSDVVKAEKKRFQEETEGADGIADEILPTLGYVARNPLISMANVAGSVAIPGFAVKGVGGVAQALKFGEKASSRMGLAAGSALGGAMGGGDAAGTAYDLVMKTPIETLVKTPQYQALADQGMSPSSIVESLATNAANEAKRIPGAIGAVSGLVGFERLLAGGKGFSGGAIKRGAKAGTVEAVPEAIEEGATTYEGQAAAAKLNPEINPLKGVGSAATMGGVMGFASGGAIGAITPPEPPAPSAGDLIRRDLQPETGALSKAVNAGIEAQAQKADATGVLPGAELAPEPIDDPFADRIRALPDGPRQEALRAYAVVNNPDAPKGVLNYNRGLLDRLLREDEESKSPLNNLALKTDTDVAGLLGPVNADPLQGALRAVQEEAAANINIANWMQRATPFPIERAQELATLAKEQRGMDMTVVPHSSGKGFTVIPAQWVTPAMRNMVGGALGLDRPAATASEQGGVNQAIPSLDREFLGGANVGATASMVSVGAGASRPASSDAAGNDGPGAVRPAVNAKPTLLLPAPAKPASSRVPRVAMGAAVAPIPLTNGEANGAQADQAQQTETQQPQVAAAGNGPAQAQQSPVPAAPGGDGVQAAGVGEVSDSAPGSDVGSGFKQGPVKGERYRVGVINSVGGAVALEKRLPAGTSATFYVGKDGNLIDGDSVNLIGSGRERLWIPKNRQQADEATAILDEMGKLALNDPKRADAKKRLKALVAASQEQSVTPAANTAPESPPPPGVEAAAKPGSTYEQRNADRIARVNKAKTVAEAEAAQADEYGDDERNFEATQKVQSAVRRRKQELAEAEKLASENEASKRDFEAGKWVIDNDLTDTRANFSEEKLAKARQDNPDTEYAVSTSDLGSVTTTVVKKRKKARPEPASAPPAAEPITVTIKVKEDATGKTKSLTIKDADKAIQTLQQRRAAYVELLACLRG